MPLNLPAPIAAYITAENEDDGAAVANCFAENAIVRDEGRTMVGLAAIQQWKRETKQKYHHTIAPLASVQKDGKTVVTSRLTGDFPGGSVDVQFIFEIASDRIISLEIHP